MPSADEAIAIEVPDFNQLAPLMQEVGKAVFNIAQKDTARLNSEGLPWKGGTWRDAEVRMQGYKKLFEKLSNIIRAWE